MKNYFCCSSDALLQCEAVSEANSKVSDSGSSIEKSDVGKVVQPTDSGAENSVHGNLNCFSYRKDRVLPKIALLRWSQSTLTYLITTFRMESYLK
jgi:hypothetical protein